MLLPRPRAREPPGCYFISNVVELVTGPEHALILILVLPGLVQDAIGKDIGQSIVLMHIMAWGHQTQKNSQVDLLGLAMDE